MILIMIIVLPLLTYSSTDDSSEFTVELLEIFNNHNTLNPTNPVTNLAKQALLNTLLSSTNANNAPNHYLLYLQVAPLVTEAYNITSQTSTSINNYNDLVQNIAFNAPALYSQSSTLHADYDIYNVTYNATSASAMVDEVAGRAVFSQRILAQTDALYQVKTPSLVSRLHA